MTSEAKLLRYEALPVVVAAQAKYENALVLTEEEEMICKRGAEYRTVRDAAVAALAAVETNVQQTAPPLTFQPPVPVTRATEAELKGSARRCTVLPSDVQAYLPELEHVMQGPQAFHTNKGMIHTGCARSAKRLEELALPIAKALTEVPPMHMIENLRASNPLLADQFFGHFNAMYMHLQEGMVVAGRQSLDIYCSVDVSNKKMDNFRGSLASANATKELSKFMAKEREKADTVALKTAKPVISKPAQHQTPKTAGAKQKKPYFPKNKI